MNKVIGGTPVGSASLCATCRNAHRQVGINMQVQVRCLRTSDAPLVSFPVAECSNYDDKRIPSLSNMYDIAWNVESRNRGPVGFGNEAQTEIRIVSPRERGIPDQAATPTALNETLKGNSQ